MNILATPKKAGEVKTLLDVEITTPNEIRLIALDIRDFCLFINEVHTVFINYVFQLEIFL